MSPSEFTVGVDGKPVVILSMEDAQHVYLTQVDAGYYSRHPVQCETVAEKIAAQLNPTPGELAANLKWRVIDA